MIAVRPNLKDQGESSCELIEPLQPCASYGDKDIVYSAIQCSDLGQSFLE